MDFPIITDITLIRVLDSESGIRVYKLVNRFRTIALNPNQSFSSKVLNHYLRL